MIRVNAAIAIAEWELSEQFTRARGPGGQHVNRSESAVQLRFEAARSPHLPPAVKARLQQLAGRRWGRDGALTIRAEAHRSQALNRRDAREQLLALLRAACERQAARLPTRPGRAATRRRLEAKRARGALKRGRGPLLGDD